MWQTIVVVAFVVALIFVLRSPPHAEFRPAPIHNLLAFWKTYAHVRRPPALQWRDGDVLVVLDALEAYRELFPAKKVSHLRATIRSARTHGVPVVFTQWARTVRGAVGDVIDRKGHWSDYIPASQNRLLVAPLDDEPVIPTMHTNAFAHPAFLALVKDKTRLVLCGSWTEACITNTARGATEHPWLNTSAVVASATAGYHHTMSLVKLQMLYADVVA